MYYFTFSPSIFAFIWNIGDITCWYDVISIVNTLDPSNSFGFYSVPFNYRAFEVTRNKYRMLFKKMKHRPCSLQGSEFEKDKSGVMGSGSQRVQCWCYQNVLDSRISNVKYKKCAMQRSKTYRQDNSFWINRRTGGQI